MTLNSCTAMAARMSALDRFLFDLNGFLVVRGVFTAEEVARANAAIDRHSGELHARDAEPLRNAKGGTHMAADGPRQDMGGMLWWQQPDSDVFRDVLTHPRLVPFYTDLLGEGFRLDHQPLVIAQSPQSEGFALHGGPIARGEGGEGRWNADLQYRCVGGRPWTSLLAASVQLVDHNAGDGGFAVLPGSHKLNLPVPAEVADGAAPELLVQPTTRAGDVVLFSEATVHGATPWRPAAPRERRIALYRFAPATSGYGRGHYEVPAEAKATLTPEQLAVLEPPYARRLERPALQVEDGVTTVHTSPRSAAKRAFDTRLFGVGYF